MVNCAPVCGELLVHPKAKEALTEEILAKTEIAVDCSFDEQLWREAEQVSAASCDGFAGRGEGTPKR